MKILFVSTWYHPLVGGIVTQTRLLANEFSREHDVEVAAAVFEDRHQGRLKPLLDNLLIPPAESYRDGDVTVHALTPTAMERIAMLPLAARVAPVARYRFYQQLREFGYAFFRRVFVPKLRKVIRGKDIVHSVASDYMGWAAEEAARLEGVPFVVSCYIHPGQWGDEPDNVAFYNRADRAFALLDSNRAKLIELGVEPGKIRPSGVIPILADTSDPDGFRARYGVGDRPLVLFAGSLRKYKGPLAILEASEKVWQTVPDAHFFFIGPRGGEGDDEWFQRHADGRIRYLGVVSDQEKADAMAACDIFCMPSTFEVLPAVYLEAWSYGKAVLGGLAHGLPELIEGNGAGRVASHDPDELAATMVELIGNPSLREELGTRGRQLVEDNFSKRAVVERLKSTYDEVLSTQAVPRGPAP